MKAYGENGGIAPLIPNLSIRYRWVLSCTQVERTRVYWRGGWVDSRASLDVLENRWISCPGLESNRVSSIVQAELARPPSCWLLLSVICPLDCKTWKVFGQVLLLQQLLNWADCRWRVMLDTGVWLHIAVTPCLWAHRCCAEEVKGLTLLLILCVWWCLYVLLGCSVLCWGTKDTTGLCYDLVTFIWTMLIKILFPPHSKHSTYPLQRPVS
jgi:hypothetical protein